MLAQRSFGIREAAEVAFALSEGAAGSVGAVTILAKFCVLAGSLDISWRGPGGMSICAIGGEDVDARG